MWPFKPRCPVNPQEKKWIEHSIKRLIQEFGFDTLRNVEVILPLPQYFPDPYRGTHICVRKLVHRVCQYMHIDPKRIHVEVYRENRDDELFQALPTGQRSHNGPAGLYMGSNDSGSTTIAIEASKLSDPMGLVGAIAHELGHVRLLGEYRVSPDEPDHEMLTDLTTVFFGLGIFTANTAFRFSQWQTSDKHVWQTSQQGYLSEPMYGYAFACFAWMREEYNPAWAKKLKLNVRTYLKHSLQHLEKTGDTELTRPVDIKFI